LKTFRGRRASLLYQILLGAWRFKNTMDIRSITEIHNFCRAPVVGVPIAKVANTLVSRLRRVVSSYVGHLDTKMASSRSACLKYSGLAIPWYVYGPANLVGRPGCMTFRGRCAHVALPACSGHLGFYVGTKASLRGALLMALPSTSGRFGAIYLRPP
jgi:hypothetical protein